MHDQRPIVAITMGDAAGVGPEIIMKTLAHDHIFTICRPLVVGDAARLQEAGRVAGRATAELRIEAVAGPEVGSFRHGTVDCLDMRLIPEHFPWGQLSATAGEGAFQFIRAAAELALSGRVDAICTAPLNKEALHLAGHMYPGHTELLAALTQTPEVSMMLVTPKLRVIHVTTHIGLLDAIERIEPGLVERTIARGHEALVRAGILGPPHRRMRHQSARWRAWAVRARRGGDQDRPGDRPMRIARLGRSRSAACRHAVLPRRPRRLRSRCRHVSRSRSRSGKGPRARGRRKRDGRIAGHSNLGRPWNRI